MFPEKLPPNDDLDLRIVRLKVLKEKGAAAGRTFVGTACPFALRSEFRRCFAPRNDG